jgi:hypothetical protein
MSGRKEETTMPRSRAPREPKKPKGLTKEFEATIERAGADELKNMIVSRQKQLEEVVQFLKGEAPTDASRELKDLKADLALIEGPSKETKTILANQTRAILKRLVELGQ